MVIQLVKSLSSKSSSVIPVVRQPVQTNQYSVDSCFVGIENLTGSGHLPGTVLLSAHLGDRWPLPGGADFSEVDVVAVGSASLIWK